MESPWLLSAAFEDIHGRTERRELVRAAAAECETALFSFASEQDVTVVATMARYTGDVSQIH